MVVKLILNQYIADGFYNVIIYPWARMDPSQHVISLPPPPFPSPSAPRGKEKKKKGERTHTRKERG